jgi:hypothetical protein
MAKTLDFDVPDFEKRLLGLKDTQESIQQLSTWCLQHRASHKKVVTSWLNVLKQGMCYSTNWFFKFTST